MLKSIWEYKTNSEMFLMGNNQAINATHLYLSSLSCIFLVVVCLFVCFNKTPNFGHLIQLPLKEPEAETNQELLSMTWTCFTSGKYEEIPSY